MKKLSYELVIDFFFFKHQIQLTHEATLRCGDWSLR